VANIIKIALTAAIDIIKYFAKNIVILFLINYGNDTRYTETILGVRFFQANAGGYYKFRIAKERYPCSYAYRWRKVNLLSGTCNGN
jgi:hypothetical protein